jgi:oxygen-independent coproporphyrinogen-3 oxidase
VNFSSKFETAISQLKEMQLDGLVEMSEQEIRVTPLGRLFMRNIACCFDAYLEKHRESAASRFSQSI